MKQVNKNYVSATMFTLVFSVVVALVMPLGYFFISYKYLKGVMETEAEINAYMVSRLVSANPDLWRYETVRLEGLLSRRPRSGVAETRRIYDIKGDPVAESINLLTAPKISTSYDVKDSGETVGRIVISRSLQPVLVTTGLLGVLGLCLGFLLYRCLPFKALIKAGAELQEANDFLKKVMEGSTNSIVVLELSGTIKMFNRQFEDLSGFPTSELLGYQFSSLFSSSRQAQVGAELGRVTGSEVDKVQFETDYFRPDGTKLSLLVGAVPLISNACINCLVISLEDISARVIAEEERLELERNLLQTQKLESLGVLAGGIAHDFNNILTIIIGYCQLFKEEFSVSSTQNMYLENIENASNRAADLCQQMLAYAGRQELNHALIDLNSLVENIVKMLHACIDKNISIEFDHAETMMISADSSQIQQVVMNLIINAAEAIGGELGLIRISLRKVSVEDQSVVDFFGKTIKGEHYVCLEVSDNGCGMDEATQSRFFEPFYTTKFSGRGLGMSVTVGIINAHDGSLQLETTPGLGTTFKIYLPLAMETVPTQDSRIEVPIL